MPEIAKIRSFPQIEYSQRRSRTARAWRCLWAEHGRCHCPVAVEWSADAAIAAAADVVVVVD